MTTGAWLVTVLGTDPRPARYTLGGHTVEAVLAPLALVQLLPVDRRPARILALCTAEARARSWPSLHGGLKDSSVDAHVVEIGADPTDARSFLHTVATAIPVEGAPAGLMIDATHGFRHYSLLTYLTLQYLSELRGIPICNAFYGLWCPLEQGESPFLDLRALLVLPEWIHSLRAFNETGDASALARLIDHDGDRAARDIAKELQQISEAREAGLPLELGETSARFHQARRKSFKKALAARGALLEDELWRKLEEPLQRFGFSTPISSQGWKKDVALTAEELERQAALVDDLLERGSIAVALGLMNEWTVSRVIFEKGNGASWLDYHAARRAAATALGALGALAQDPVLGTALTDAQQRLGHFWRDLAELRNAFHHHGMRPQVLVGAGTQDVENKLEAVRAYWHSLETFSELPVQFPAATRRLLVSAVGRNPGVLYNAVDACRRAGTAPDACLVLVSDETSGVVDDAMQAAGFGGPVHRLRIADPYGGGGEIVRLAREARSALVTAQEVAVNLTGGTTLMGLAVSAIADEAARLAREVRRFGLVDRRLPGEQDTEPYRAADACWLTPRSSDGD